MELRIPVEERLGKVEQKLHDLKVYMMNDLKQDVEKSEERFEKKVEKMEIEFWKKIIAVEENNTTQFRWLIGTLLTIFTILILLILGLCVR